MSSRRRSAVTLKDVAQATGFSANTVSRALSNKPDISEETKQLIRQQAHAMGYIPNALASFLRSGVSKTVSIIVGDISNAHFAVIVKDIQTLLQKKGYTCTIFNTEEKQELERLAITVSISQNVDGIIICPVPNGQQNIQLLQQHDTPYVLLGRYFGNMDTCYVVCDDKHSGYIATRFLLENGHQEILFLNGPRGISSSSERLRGYQCALQEAGIPYRKELVHTVPLLAGKSEKKMEQILQDCTAPTALLGFSDLIAWRAICLLEKMGRSVPAMCSVIGFDNVNMNFPMKLTSVSSSGESMAKKAVDLLMRQLMGLSMSPEHVILETQLIEGATVLPINRFAE